MLLFTALAGLFTIWAWPSQKGLIDRLDGKIAGLYSGRYTSRLDHASSLLASGKSAESKKEFEAIVAELSGVDKEETLAYVYGRALSHLFSISRDEQDLRRGLAYAKALVELEPNDYGYWLNYAVALENSGARGDAIKAYYRAYAIAPQSLAATRAMSKVFFDEKKDAEARGVIAGYFEANRATQVYAYFAGGGEGFSKSKMGSATSVITGRRQAFRVPVGSAGVERMRIDFRGLVDMDVELLSISIVTPDSTFVFPAGDIELATFGLNNTGVNRYETTGRGDMKLGFPIPGELRGAKVLAVSIEAVFSPKIPPDFSGVLRGS